MAAKADLPGWLLALTAFLILSNLTIFGFLSIFYPHWAFPDGGASAAFPTQFMAARHVAFALPLLHGLLKKDAKILTTMYTIFFVMAVMDIGIITVYSYEYIPLVVSLIGTLPYFATVALGIFLFILPMGYVVRYLRTNFPD